MIIHLPHSSRIIPERYRNQFIVDELRLQHEIDVMTDSFTDELFASEHSVKKDACLVFPVSRLLVDPERFADDALEMMSAKGMGVIYSKTHEGELLRRDLKKAEREELLAQYYFPHQQKVAATVESELKEKGCAMLVDGHSFPDHSLPCYNYRGLDTPDFCLGTDAYHTPQKLTEAIERKIIDLGFTVRINFPFAGAFVPLEYYQKEKNVFALMIEVNRRLYMNETRAEKSENFLAIQKVVNEILTTCETWLNENHIKFKK